jgi:hypothetical protein
MLEESRCLLIPVITQACPFAEHGDILQEIPSALPELHKGSLEHGNVSPGAMNVCALANLFASP